MATSNGYLKVMKFQELIYNSVKAYLTSIVITKKKTYNQENVK